jgi:hypothetical protein
MLKHCLWRWHCSGTDEGVSTAQREKHYTHERDLLHCAHRQRSAFTLISRLSLVNNGNIWSGNLAIIVWHGSRRLSDGRKEPLNRNIFYGLTSTSTRAHFVKLICHVMWSAFAGVCDLHDRVNSQMTRGDNLLKLQICPSLYILQFSIPLSIPCHTFHCTVFLQTAWRMTLQLHYNCNRNLIYLFISNSRFLKIAPLLHSRVCSPFIGTELAATLADNRVWILIWMRSSRLPRIVQKSHFVFLQPQEPFHFEFIGLSL